MVHLLIAFLACTPDSNGKEHVDSSSEEADTGLADSGSSTMDCQPFEGAASLPTDWYAWAEGMKAEVQATGACPTYVDDVAMSDGCVYSAETTVLEAPWAMLGHWRDDDLESLYLVFSSSDQYEPGCIEDDVTLPPDGAIGGDLGVDVSTMGWPFVAASIEAYNPGGTLAASLGGSGHAESQVPESAYFLLCVDQAAPVPGYQHGPATAQGSLFVHVERWDEGGGAVPADYLVLFDHNDCALAEDARGLLCDGGVCWWPPYCDGIDNDYDGTVDDGAQDCDGNGVPDCQEHDAANAPACDG